MLGTVVAGIQAASKLGPTVVVVAILAALVVAPSLMQWWTARMLITEFGERLTEVIVREDQIDSDVVAVGTRVAAVESAVKELRTELRRQFELDREAAAKRFDEDRADSERRVGTLTGWLNANCFANANGDASAWERCEEMLRRGR